MNKYVLYFRFEPYLAQWFLHEMGGTSPAELPRGSVEADILRLFLAKRPDDVPVDTGKDANLAIVIPAFKEKEAETYNYLDTSAVHCLHKCIRSRFDVQLWQDLHKVHPRSNMLKDLVEAWMVSHGIEFNDTNWCAVTKRYQRKRDIYRRREKKSQKNARKMMPLCPRCRNCRKSRNCRNCRKCWKSRIARFYINQPFHPAKI